MSLRSRLLGGANSDFGDFDRPLAPLRLPGGGMVMASADEEPWVPVEVTEYPNGEWRIALGGEEIARHHFDPEVLAPLLSCIETHTWADNDQGRRAMAFALTSLPKEKRDAAYDKISAIKLAVKERGTVDIAAHEEMHSGRKLELFRFQGRNGIDVGLSFMGEEVARGPFGLTEDDKRVLETGDPERSMEVINRAIAPLGDDARARVLKRMREISTASTHYKPRAPDVSDFEMARTLHSSKSADGSYFEAATKENQKELTLRVTSPDGSLVTVLHTDDGKIAGAFMNDHFETLPQKDRQRLVKEIERAARREEAKARKLRGQLNDLRGQRDKLATEVEVSTERFAALFEWQGKHGEHLRLERPANSALHRFHEACDASRVVAAFYGVFFNDPPWTTLKESVPFVVEHDWSAALKSSGEPEGADFQLPFPNCAFEFRITGRRVIAMQGDELLAIFVEDSEGWALPQFMYARSGGEWTVHQVPNQPFAHGDQFEPLKNMVTRQIAAVSIMLEAEVAETDVIRAPHRLNHQREKKGKPPVVDYHVVRLANRRRYTPLPDDLQSGDGEKRRSPRMHFVRGHYVHFRNHRTWRKWHLRGDPDLGFIDKHYRL